ncbi:DUF397 domain-containing protein [Actinokineospora spheciospongiae]|uniref:DUF397 domain-containing protein n=1 Tax=Actinokineospora spheciospongiae TaxID=909613 RepID=UPI000D70A40D|nr:DUF397 domain-containing protein [Actinokineospora spheciospongiae]PWW59439.1 uncharacterized protein DUF397 [Actinokineospora spheciospongiae]
MSPRPTWRKSTRSTNDQSCVEVLGTLTALRDSKNTTGPTLTTHIPTLITAIKSGHVTN